MPFEQIDGLVTQLFVFVFELLEFCQKSAFALFVRIYGRKVDSSSSETVGLCVRRSSLMNWTCGPLQIVSRTVQLTVCSINAVGVGRTHILRLVETQLCSEIGILCFQHADSPQQILILACLILKGPPEFKVFLFEIPASLVRQRSNGSVIELLVVSILIISSSSIASIGFGTIKIGVGPFVSIISLYISILRSGVSALVPSSRSIESLKSLVVHSGDSVHSVVVEVPFHGHFVDNHIYGFPGLLDSFGVTVVHGSRWTQTRISRNIARRSLWLQSAGSLERVLMHWVTNHLHLVEESILGFTWLCICWLLFIWTYKPIKSINIKQSNNGIIIIFIYSQET